MTYPVVHDWTLIRGDSDTRRFVYSTTSEPATDPDEWGVVMQVRRDTGTEVWLEKSPADGLTLGVEDGKLTITVSIDPLDTQEWGRAKWNGRWDLQITHPSGRVFTPVGGAFTVFGDVTVVSGE